MATYSSREQITRHIEYVVPCDGPWGACWSEVAKALGAAENSYRQIHDIDEKTALTDDALRFFVGDDEILIRFEVKQVKPHG